MKGMNKHAWRSLRRNLCDRYGGCCAYCKVYVGLRGTVDHYVPQSMGGRDDIGNLRWSCHACNQLKGDMSPREWAMFKVPERRVETKYEKRIRLLSGIAQRGQLDIGLILILAFIAIVISFYVLAAIHYDSVRCIEGYKFTRPFGGDAETQILDGEGHGIPCEAVRTPARKPLT